MQESGSLLVPVYAGILPRDESTICRRSKTLRLSWRAVPVMGTGESHEEVLGHDVSGPGRGILSEGSRTPIHAK